MQTHHPHHRKHVVKNPFIVFATAFSILMLVLSVFVAMSKLEGVSGDLIVNLDPFNSPMLGNASGLMSLFWILAGVIAINVILVYEIYRREPFISYILSSSSMIVSILIFIATSIIVSLN